MVQKVGRGRDRRPPGEGPAQREVPSKLSADLMCARRRRELYLQEVQRQVTPRTIVVSKKPSETLAALDGGAIPSVGL